MRKTTSLLLVLSLSLGACGTIRDSRVNPLNWFGNARSEPAASAGAANPLIPASGGLFSGRRAERNTYEGRPFEQISNLTVEQVPGGAIICATGIAAHQGIYEVRLIPANPDELPVEGTLTYRLEGIRPTGRTAVGTIPTREVIAARRVTDQTLAGVTAIRVEGQLNAQVARR